MSLRIIRLVFTLFLLAFIAKAQNQLDSLKQQVEEMPADSTKAATLLSIGELLGQTEEAKDYNARGMELAKSLDNKDLMVSAYVLKAYAFEFDEIDKKIPYLDSAISISKATNNLRGVAMVRISKALIYRTYGFYDEALQELQLSYEYGVESNNENWQAAVTYHLCRCYIEMEKPEEAYPYCQKIANYYEKKQGIDSLFRYRLISFSYFSLAEVSGKLGNIELATDQYLKSYYYGTHANIVQNDLVLHLTNLVNLASEILASKGDTNIISMKIRTLGFPYIKAVLDTAIVLAKTDTTEENELYNDVLESRRQWALANEDYKEAYQLLEQIKALDEAGRLNENNIDAVADFKVKSERDQLRISLLEEEIQSQKKSNQANLLLLFLGITLLLLIVSLLVYQNRQKSNHLLLSAAKEEQQVISMRSMLEGQEQERARIARDLHDGLGNMLATLKSNMENLQEQVQDQQTGKIYAQSGDMIDEAYTEVRRIAHEMMPQALEKLGLLKALGDLVEKMNINHPFKASFDVYGEEQVLDDNTNIMLYRIVQELFNNIIKYANAKEVLLQMTYSKEWLNLTVEDDGKGFDPAELTNNQGIGLKSIAFRTQYIGGGYEIGRRPDLGTSVSINVPLDQNKT